MSSIYPSKVYFGRFVVYLSAAAKKNGSLFRSGTKKSVNTDQFVKARVEVSIYYSLNDIHKTIA